MEFGRFTILIVVAIGILVSMVYEKIQNSSGECLIKTPEFLQLHTFLAIKIFIL